MVIKVPRKGRKGRNKSDWVGIAGNNTGIPTETIVIEGVTYYLVRDDITNEPLRDPETGQFLYDLVP